MPSPPWAFHAHPTVWAIVFVIGFYYFYWIHRRDRVAEPLTERTPRRKKILFAAGLVSMWIAADWPIHDVAERSLYFVHMFQHMIFTFASAPLMLAGIPDWMFRKIISPKPIFRLAKFLSRPIIALAVFNVILVFSHWPLVVNAVVGHEWLHFGAHVLLFASAIVLWLPILSPVIEIPRASLPGQMVYLFAQSIVPTVPASFLTFGSKPLYSAYVSLPKLWHISPLTDQLSAGLIMKILGGFILWGWLAVLFFKWWSIEHNEGVDVLAFRNVDRDLNRGASRT
ncbi:MAG: cytochrome c oxidase assembly protein [Actinomycetota bacterium]